jgi:hypothetical protein
VSCFPDWDIFLPLFGRLWQMLGQCLKCGHWRLQFMIYVILCVLEKLLITGKQTGVKVNAEKTKYMVMFRDKNAGQNSNVQTDTKSFETVE